MRLNVIAKAKAMQTLLPVCIAFLALRSVTAQYVANTQALIIKEIEHLYFDAAPSGILSAVTPCSNYYDPSTGASNDSLGRNTAAEWIRTAFRKLPDCYINLKILLHLPRIGDFCLFHNNYCYMF